VPGTSKGPSRREISAGGVVFRRVQAGIEVVLIRAAGRWSFPKGAIEKAESTETAALREISEETGLPLKRLRLIAPLPDVEYAFRWGEVLVFKTVHYFLVHLTAEAPLRPQLSEIEAAAWYATDAARRAIGFKNARETLAAAVAEIDRLEQAS